MCILFIHRDPGADSNSYRLILASNRDEILRRPALAAHFWEKYSGCLGGTDMEPGKEGGTWLAMSIKGKAGVILNLVDKSGNPVPPKKGRGSLITNYIASDDSAEVYLNQLHEENQNGQPYNPYNLVLVNLHNANVHYLSSCEKSTGPLTYENDVLAFGNSGTECPYRKVEKGKEKFNNIIKGAKVSEQDNLIEELLKFLKSKERYLPDPELERRCPTMFNELSSIFVSATDYGTRTHSILLVNGDNKATFLEETLKPDFTWKRQLFDINLVQEKEC
ncbi:hypothetical protein KM043_013763 [Ampulex compressa]|nr:hypothetical protein KM043_013763 [Ampulex compressa]